MAAHNKQLLHELLKENQEPFRLKNYIAERRSQLKNPVKKTVLQIKRQKTMETVPTCLTKPASLCKHACFIPSQNSPDVRRSPFPSPLKSPCKSPRGGATVFLHVPSRTAAMLVEAAMRIQKQQPSKTNKAGFGLFGSFLKRLKDRSKNRKPAIGNNETQIPTTRRQESEGKVEENVRISCSCDNRAAELEASTSSCIYRSLEEMVDKDFISEDMLFPDSPFRFSLRRSPSCSGSAAGRTPEFCSPAASPRLPVTQEKENHKSKSPKAKNGEEDDEDKEHCSPVSILDPPFEDDDGHETEGGEGEDDYDLDGSYANVERTKQQLLYRLRRFEKLAGLDPVELERKMLESSDEETVTEAEEDDSLPSHDTLFMSIDLKKLVAEPPEVRGKGQRADFVVFGRIFNRLGSWKEFEFDRIGRMIDMDFKMDVDGWNGFPELVEEIAAEFELELFGMFVEELCEELLCT
ncbi:histone-lysine N-methyltransferase SETD1B-like [Dorcoceras hygrometricum]|uniref:Histone-lysine N-methyltransferase SETD1B-like n=1 Tax=Dorcoceras hygrometricum TaxID=472368 RepID=A0A2Z7A198_9LAMI|nr:histone-lysine N-methyltransferase SETD1B-like [Dorcoceras hygrometricum]